MTLSGCACRKWRSLWWKILRFLMVSVLTRSEVPLVSWVTLSSFRLVQVMNNSDVLHYELTIIAKKWNLFTSFIWIVFSRSMTYWFLAGAVPWILITELFATAPRAAASSVAVGVNRISGLVIALAFPYIQVKLLSFLRRRKNIFQILCNK